MSKNRKITYMGLGIALYVVLSYTIKIPLINRIRTDPGYLAFGLFLCLFGTPGTLVGVLGCIISNLLYSGTANNGMTGRSCRLLLFLPPAAYVRSGPVPLV